MAPCLEHDPKEGTGFRKKILPKGQTAALRASAGKNGSARS
jgi:hypothetical protein